MASDRSTATLLEYLTTSGVNYEVVEHEEFTSLDDAMNKTGLNPNQAAKSLLYESIGGLALVVLPLSRRVSNAKLRLHLDSTNVKLATKDEVLAVTGSEVGYCHAMGSLYGASTIADVSLSEVDVIGFSAGDARHTIKMSFNDYTCY